MLQTFCYEMIVTCLDKEDSQLQVSPALRLIVLPLFFPPKWNLELESLWTLYVVQYVNTPHSYTNNSNASKLSGLVIRPNNLIHCRMRSIIDHLKQSRNFPRLRIGIGRPPEEMGAISFVLGSFSNQEKEELEVTFQRGLQAVRIMVREEFNKSATFVNTPQPLEMLNRWKLSP